MCALSERVLVTGAGGFIGQHLVAALRGLGCEPLTTTRRTNTPVQGTLPLDLSKPGDTRRVIAEARPDVVYHLAGTRGRRDRGAEECALVNVLATTELLEAATESGARRVVIVGSAEEYGLQPGPLTEDLPPRPLSAYGASKAAATHFALALAAKRSCPVVILRPFTVFGPGQAPDMFVAEAVRSAICGQPFRMTQGTQRRDFVYVDDVVSALVAASRANAVEGLVFNIGSGQSHALREVAQLIWTLSGTEAPLMIGARAAAPDEMADTWADNSRARDALGWTPRISLEQGLERTIANGRAAEKHCRG